MKVASLLFLITFFISCNISNVNKDEIVAEVNGEKIYLSEFHLRVNKKFLIC